MKKYRLVTRSDMDGLVCAVLLNELEMINDIKFVHPKDMQDGLIDINENDIITNLPYIEKAHIVFDHHLSETIRNKEKKDNHIIDPDAPSAARVVYKHYGGKNKFKEIDYDMILAVDKADSAQFSLEDILYPKGWDLLSFIMDARTGLGRFKNFKISNYALMMDLIKYCKNHSIEEILELPDVKERVDFFLESQKSFKKQIEKCSKIYNNVLVVDFRNETTIYPGNRFLKYAIFPEINISIQVMWGLNKQNTVFAVGKSIFNKTSKVNIGELMLKRNGGGHKAAGTCQLSNDVAQGELLDLIKELRDSE